MEYVTDELVSELHICHLTGLSTYLSKLSVSYGSVCGECDGTGEVECEACEGNGRRIVTCKVCYGLGEFCPVCHGTGKTEVQCDECEDGMNPCSSCESAIV